MCQKISEHWFFYLKDNFAVYKILGSFSPHPRIFQTYVSGSKSKVNFIIYFPYMRLTLLGDLIQTEFYFIVDVREINCEVFLMLCALSKCRFRVFLFVLNFRNIFQHYVLEHFFLFDFFLSSGILCIVNLLFALSITFMYFINHFFSIFSLICLQCSILCFQLFSLPSIGFRFLIFIFSSFISFRCFGSFLSISSLL